MLTEINAQLAELRLMVRHEHNWSARQAHLQRELEQLSLDVRSLRRQWADVAAADGDQERRSFGETLRAILLRRRDRPSRAEQQALQLKLRLEEAEDTQRDLERERTELIAKLAGLEQAERRYGELLEQKRQLLAAHYPELAEQLHELTEQQNARLADLRELEEAIAVGRGVLHDLDRASRALEAAGHYGTWDLYGGGLMAGAMKYEQIDTARVAIHAAQDGLRRFAEEAKDVRHDIQVRIDIGGALRLADFFFDGLVVDWIVRDRIETSSQELLNKLYQLRRIVDGLVGEAAIVRNDAQQLGDRITTLIEES